MTLPSWQSVEWGDPAAAVSPHFTVREALWLPQWGRLARESDGLTDHVKAALTTFFQGPAELVRVFLARPIVTHCSFRPPAYNALPAVKGAPDSAHVCRGPWAALDFHVEGLTCDHVRALLLPRLALWRIRMERRPGSDWVHIDNRPILKGGSRYFYP